MAGTGSHKPYLFNAENVARHAPPAWHCEGTVVDRSYEALDEAARGARALAGPGPARAPATAEPALQGVPPAELGLAGPDAGTAERLRGREVWLVHPWALRAPPVGVPPDAVCIGLYLHEHHAAWPWPAARWRWVDAAMAAVTTERWHTGSAEAALALGGAARVRSVDDPHLTRWLQRLARLDAAPMLFPAVERHCSSFSQWWTRATRGLQQAGELL